MSSVFICHSSQDKPFVRRLCVELEKHGVTFWLDEREIRVGESLRKRIESGLSQSTHVIVVLSQLDLDSRWVQDELSAAFSLEKQRNKDIILPILIEKTQLPVFLLDKKFAGFSKSFESGFVEILAALGPIAAPSTNINLETLSCRVVLDIQDTEGKLVSYSKHQVVVCRHGPESSYIEAFTADGSMTDFVVNPGRIERQWKESGLTYIRTAFPQPLQDAEQATRSFTFLMHDAFAGQDEYWEQKQHHPSKNVELLVVFPSSRPPLSFTVKERVGTVTRASVHEVETVGIANRPALRLFVPSRVTVRIPS